MTEKIKRFEDLFIWQKAIQFAKDIYFMVEISRIKSDFGLRNQICRAAVSISTNIAEGFERRSRKEYLNFLNIAKASSGEVRSLLYVAFEVGYLAESEFEVLREKSKFLSGSITNHMKSISKASN